MDGFKDKIAKKFNAQEIIRANMAADAAHMDKLEKQVSEYDSCMKEMRKLNLRGIENEQKLKSLLKEGESTLKGTLAGYEQQIQRLADKCIAKIHELYPERNQEGEEELMEQIRALAAENMQEMRELFQKSDEHTHRENVKVYRNVQAVIAEELEGMKELAMDIRLSVKSRMKKLLVINIFLLLFSAANLGLLVAHLLGMF